MNKSQQQRRTASGTGGTERSRTRRAALIATGRTLFADTSYDALSMDDIARRAGVAKGLIYYYFGNKRGYYLAIIEDAVDELVQRAGSTRELPPVARVRRTVDGYLRYAQHHQAAYRAIVTGGVGFDAEVLAIRARVRARLLATIARGAWGREGIPPLARTALTGWLSSVEGVTLDWIERPELPRETVVSLLVRGLGDTLRLIEEYEPDCPAPPRPPA
ncbi:TetR/AcrR family transcriptional regulator [Streptomyces sp. RS10V-4]|uniref:TetR/AcrR family transcriptional regulator n=1 Tax=Streptomyces rhizoryzae TaxID=2932493 RepID=UPI0020045633|nr:TetR/AcrR family transcriptional regulator [Streptomyces rhizoryzae]MCK7621600.1 TetR/AcrR family transcriptional regulator [Streptomyces rhizoryzae]